MGACYRSEGPVIPARVTPTPSSAPACRICRHRATIAPPPLSPPRGRRGAPADHCGPSRERRPHRARHSTSSLDGSHFSARICVAAADACPSVAGRPRVLPRADATARHACADSRSSGRSCLEDPRMNGTLRPLCGSEMRVYALGSLHLSPNSH